MSGSPAFAKSRPAPLWKCGSFHLLWSSTYFSGVGDRLIMGAALPLLGYGIAGADNASIQSGIDFFFFLPYLLWSPLAGWLADRMPRKWLMFAADELRGLLTLAACVFLAQGGEPGPVEVWAVVLGVGLMAATFVPAKLSVVPNVVEPVFLPRANAVVVSMGVVGNLTGAVLGGFLAGDRPDRMLMISAACYAGSGLFWIFLKTPWRHGESESVSSVWQIAGQIRTGLTYGFSHRVLKRLIATAFLIWTGTSLYMPALAVVNADLYGRGAEGFLLLLAPLGAGMLLGAMVVGAANPRRGHELLMSLGLLGCGVCIGLQMVVPVFAAGCVLAFCSGFFASLVLVSLNTLTQRLSADRVRGRVMAAKEMLAESGKVVLALLIWRVAGLDPLMRPFTGVYALLLVVLALWAAGRFVLRGPFEGAAKNLLWRINRLWVSSVHRLEVRGAGHVPGSGPVLLVANHTAGVDPMLIQAGCRRMVRWMIAAEYRIEVLEWLWRVIRPISVQRHQRDSHAAREAIEALRAGEVVGLFPEGHIREHSEAGLRELEAGVGLIASRGGAVIVPVWIEGTPVTRSPFAALIRPSYSRIQFGLPIRPEPGDDRSALVERVARALKELEAVR